MYHADTGYWSFTAGHGSARAFCRTRPGEVEVSMIDDLTSDAPARRWPDQVLPNVNPGSVAFAGFVPLAQAREWLPQYSSLWDEAERRAVDMCSPNREHGGAAGVAEHQHVAFFSLPY